MNIYDISQKAGVSIATVSRVINNSSNVSEKTKQKVLKVMNESDYTPNVFARGLGKKSMQTVGILCMDSSDIYIAQAVYFLERELRARGYNSILCCTGYQLKDKQSSLKLLLSKQIDAIILIGSSYIEEKESDVAYIKNAAKQLPIILLNGHLEGENIYSILCDDYNATKDAVLKLIDNHKKEILFLYRAATYSGKQKLRGYKKAHQLRNLPVNENLICLCDEETLNTTTLFDTLSKKGIRFNGVMAADDQLAIKALKYARKQSILIPQSLEIIGYNNSILGTCCEPELTSIDNKVEAICTTATTTLMRVFEAEDSTSKIVLSSTLIERQTTRF